MKPTLCEDCSDLTNPIINHIPDSFINHLNGLINHISKCGINHCKLKHDIAGIEALIGDSLRCFKKENQIDKTLVASPVGRDSTVRLAFH